MFIWDEGFILKPSEGVNLGFLAMAIVVNAPASIITAVGLRKMRQGSHVASWRTRKQFNGGSA